MIAELVLTCCMANPNLVLEVSKVARELSIPEVVMHAIIIVESNYKPMALNDKKPPFSYGLGQLTEDTAMSHCNLSLGSIYNTTKNIRCSAKVFKYQMDRYHGNINQAISAYNAGTFTPKNTWYVDLVNEKINEINEAKDVDTD